MCDVSISISLLLDVITSTISHANRGISIGIGAIYSPQNDILPHAIGSFCGRGWCGFIACLDWPSPIGESEIK